MGWIVHAVVDVALGIGLLLAGVHGHGPDYLVLDVAAAYLLALTVVTNGPGGLWKVVPRLVHRILDGVMAVALMGSPLIVWASHVHVDVFATAMAVAVGVILLRDALVTDHRVVPIRAGRSGRGRTGRAARRGAEGPIETTAFATPAAAGSSRRAAGDPGASAGDRSTSGRGAGGGTVSPAVGKAARKLGRVSATVQNQMPDAARRAGVVAGRTRRAARAARGTAGTPGAPGTSTD
jgi:hypothetical protein